MLRLEMLSVQGVFCSYKYYKEGFTIYVSVRMCDLDWYWNVTTVKSTDGSDWRDEQVNGKQPQIVGGQAETTTPHNSEAWACLVIYPINIDLPKQNSTHNYELIASDWRCFYFISAEILQ